MLQSEFETITGIFPDVLTYEEIEKEYNNGSWEDKTQFCAAYTEDKDGLAHKVQTAVNKRWYALEDQKTQLIKENDELRRQIEELTIEIVKYGEHVDEIQKKLDAMPVQQVVNSNNLKIAEMKAITAAANDDNMAETILHMVWAFQYLEEELKVKK